MATFGALQTAVSKRLLDAQNVSVSQQDVATSLNDAIAYWKYKRFWFNETVSSQTLTAQDGTIPLPADFLIPAYEDASFIIDYSQQRYPLEKVLSSVYDGRYMDNGYGLPRCYSRVGDSYEVYPLPDQAYTIIVRYLKDYSAIEYSNYNATNDWTDNADRLILLWSCANLIGEIRQDEKMESYFRNAAENEFRNLSAVTNKLNSSGKLTISQL